jgi:hypothetical protein
MNVIELKGETQTLALIQTDVPGLFKNSYSGKYQGYTPCCVYCGYEEHSDRGWDSCKAAFGPLQSDSSSIQSILESDNRFQGAIVVDGVEVTKEQLLIQLLN